MKTITEKNFDGISSAMGRIDTIQLRETVREQAERISNLDAGRAE